MKNSTLHLLLYGSLFSAGISLFTATPDKLHRYLYYIGTIVIFLIIEFVSDKFFGDKK